jgi:DNA-binding winged helix-turn-helix (wHTH) protein/tetratricopeptide (TPR) repeat protein
MSSEARGASGPSGAAVVRFAEYELDLRSRELRRHGVKLTVQDQPLRLLSILMERPGELATREELHRRLWPDDTFVDFEHGLNAAVKRLRTALTDVADAPRFIETLPRRGYRFIGTIDPGDGDAPETRGPRLRRLMVVPLRILRQDEDSNFLAFSVPDAIAGALSGLQSLVVRPPMAASRYAGEQLDLAAIARDAEVDAILTGTIGTAAERIRIAMQLVAVADGQILWSQTADVSRHDLFSVQDDVVHRVVESLSLSLTGRERMILESNVPSNPGSYELYLRANRILVQGIRAGEQLHVARDLYVRALEGDPLYAPAWARLGRCHWLIAKGEKDANEHLHQADVCFKRALAIDSNLLLAHSLYAQLEADLGRALPAMVRLLGLAQTAPSSPELYAALVQVCRFCGQLEASVAAAERARGLDPQISTSVNQTYWQLGDTDRAFAARAEGTFMLDAYVLAKWGRHEEAIALLREREEHLPATSRKFCESYRALLEGNEHCPALTEQAIADWPDPEGRYYLATYLSRLGHTDRALCELNRCLDDGFVLYRLLSSDPNLDPLRRVPAFSALRERAAGKYRDACVAFADAGGQRLFGL